MSDGQSIETIAGQIRQALTDHPGSTAKELESYVEVSSIEQLSRALYDMKRYREIEAVKDPECGRLRYSLVDASDTGVNGAQQHLNGNGHRHPRRPSHHSPLQGAIAALLTVIERDVQDPLMLELIRSYGDLREASARGKWA